MGRRLTLITSWVTPAQHTKEGKKMKTENSITALVKAMNKKNDAERASKVQELTAQLDLLEEDILARGRVKRSQGRLL